MTKINCCNFRGWCELEQDYQTPLQKLVLWHLLQQGTWERGRLTAENDECHCISNNSSYKHKGFAYRVMYPDIREPSLKEIGKIQPKKSGYFLYSCSTPDESRRTIYLHSLSGDRLKESIKGLVLDEIKSGAGKRAQNAWNDK